MVTLSTAASIRLAVPVSAASTCRRTDCPAYAERLTVAVAHAAARLLAAPDWVKSVVVVVPEISRTRN